MSQSAEKGVCDGCQKRPCVCETVVLPSAESDALWFHGTTAVLAPGDTLVPGVSIGRDNFPGMDNSWGVWITPNPALAAKYGPNVYAVTPTGEVTDWAEENGWDRDENNDEYVCDSAVITRVIPPGSDPH